MTGTAPAARAVISYIAKLGRVMSTSSPGSRKACPSRPMISSEPFPRRMFPGERPWNAASRPQSSRPELSG